MFCSWKKAVEIRENKAWHKKHCNKAQGAKTLIKTLQKKK